MLRGYEEAPIFEKHLHGERISCNTKVDRKPLRLPILFNPTSAFFTACISNMAVNPFMFGGGRGGMRRDGAVATHVTTKRNTCNTHVDLYTCMNLKCMLH